MVTAELDEDHINRLTAKFETAVLDRQLDWPILIIDRDDLLTAGEFLKSEPDFDFDFLTNLTPVDYIDHMEVVYHLYSYSRQHKLCVKVIIQRDDLVMDSVTGLWATADWHEREAYDLFGIVFKGHPNLTRIFCTDDFPGHPFRRDWELTNDEEYLLRDTKTSKDYGMPEELPS